MTRKKMLPLALLAAVVVLLAVLLAALHSAAEEEELPGIALCPLTAAELDTVSYSGENVEVTLQKGSGGTWRLASDPSLPLNQEDVAALVEQYAALRADRRLQGDELAEIPARQAFGVTATETEVYLLCPNAVECYRYDGVQSWARQDLAAHPLAVLDAAETLVFTGTTAEVLAPPEGAA